MSKDLYAVILAGGSGSRLWPLSREMYPKQLLKINDTNTLFQSTFMKLLGFVDDKNIISVTNVKLESLVSSQLDEMRAKFCRRTRYKVLTEPVGKNTAPAICMAVKYIQKLAGPDIDPVIIVTPADHMIKNEAGYVSAMNDGIKLAKEGYVVAFGVKPLCADTGFGYIKVKSDAAVKDIVKTACKAAAFEEKPDKEKAEAFVKSKNHYWNAGIFMFKASTIIKEFKKHSAQILNILSNIDVADSIPSVEYQKFDEMPDISIDYAIMEKSKNIALVPLDCDWNDLGSWQAILDSSPKDENGNYLVGNVKEIDCKDSLIYSTSKLVTAIGLTDTIVVETEDAVLVCDKSKSQDVKRIYDELKQENNDVSFIHKTVYRPWGYYTVLQSGDGFLTKCIQVNPSAKLSLQKHKHRSEHWVVLEGKAKVIKGEEEYILKPGQNINLAAGEVHSLQNPYSKPLKVLEVQKGEILDENDIERISDIYGRA